MRLKTCQTFLKLFIVIFSLNQSAIAAKVRCPVYSPKQCAYSSRPISDCTDLMYGQMPDQMEGEHKICHKYYLVSANVQTKTPNWVAYHLTAGRTDHRIKRKNYFCPDPCLPPGKRAELTDYMSIFPKFNRGHMTPASSNKLSPEIYKESYYLSNMVPQNPDNNGGIWKRLEDYVNIWTEMYGELYIITGPINDYGDAKHVEAGEGKLWAPAALFKIIYAPKIQSVLSFIIPNEALDPENLSAYLTSIEDINQATGLSFFSSLPKRLQLESSKELWSINARLKSIV